jgi:hypothetical protein
MAIRNIDKIIKLGAHPLESHFDIEEGSTEMVVSKRTTIPEAYEPYDSKDTEIESDYQMIMDTAMDMVDVIKESIGGAEARFLARLTEVAGQQLNIALSAAEKKAKLKDSKDKFEFRKATSPGVKNITNNNMTVIMDRNQMLEALMQNPVIDVEAIDITTKE